MTEDPARLWDEEQSEMMRSLLSAAREEQPEHAAIRRTLTVVGVGTALASVAASSSAASVAAGAGPQGVAVAASVSSAKGALGSTLLVVVKWLGAGAVMGLVATSAVAVVTQPNAPAPQAPRAKIASAKPSTPEKTASESRATPAIAPEVIELPAAAKSPAPSSAAPSVATAPPALAVPSAPDSDAQLAAELSLLDRARQALAAGNASSAVRSLNDFDSRFAHPNLLPEALYLRLEALTQQGDRPGTEAVARRLLRASPEGPHAARARAVLGLDK